MRQKKIHSLLSHNNAVVVIIIILLLFFYPQLIVYGSNGFFTAISLPTQISANILMSTI